MRRAISSLATEVVTLQSVMFKERLDSVAILTSIKKTSDMGEFGGLWMWGGKGDRESGPKIVN